MDDLKKRIITFFVGFLIGGFFVCTGFIYFYSGSVSGYNNTIRQLGITNTELQSSYSRIVEYTSNLRIEYENIERGIRQAQSIVRDIQNTSGSISETIRRIKENIRQLEQLFKTLQHD
jgi:predicted RNase H-like nuclease (RuvC/YqgF family)